MLALLSNSLYKYSIERKEMLNIKKIVTFSIVVLVLGGCNANKLNIGAGMDLLKAATVTNKEMRKMAHLAARQYDNKSSIASKNNRYAKRLNRLTRNFHHLGDLNLNYKVYMINELNAFAMADGTVRVYKGLMDKMNDAELLFVVGHEIGHVKYEHTKNAYRMAYATSAARKALASNGGTAALLSGGDAGALAQKLVNAQFSQSQELEADKNGLFFLKKAHKDPKYAVSALKKLASLGGSGGGAIGNLFSSHPAPLKRAQKIQEMIMKQ